MMLKGKYTNLYGKHKIGEHTTIGSYVEIGPKVEIGNHCKISAYAFIPSGVKIGNEVFIGPRVTFTNDNHPPSYGAEWEETIVEDRVSVGAGAVILPGLTLCKGTRIGAGAVVTKSTEPFSVMVGNPARQLD